MNSLGDLISNSQGGYTSNTSFLNGGGSPSPSVNFLKDLQTNSLGDFNLMDRLEKQYGANWRQVPAAQSLMDSFNNLLTNSQNISSVQDLFKANKVESYLQGNKISELQPRLKP